MKKFDDIYRPPSLWFIVHSVVTPFTCQLCNEQIAIGEKCWEQFLGKRRGSCYFHFACEERLNAKG